MSIVLPEDFTEAEKLLTATERSGVALPRLVGLRWFANGWQRAHRKAFFGVPEIGLYCADKCCRRMIKATDAYVAEMEKPNS